jgi:hypothetical protein
VQGAARSHSSSAGDHRLSHAWPAQVAAVPCEWPSPQGLLECGNAAFSKLGSLLTYLATELEGLQRQARRACSPLARMASAERRRRPDQHHTTPRQRSAALREAGTACLWLCAPQDAKFRIKLQPAACGAAGMHPHPWTPPHAAAAGHPRGKQAAARALSDLSARHDAAWRQLFSAGRPCADTRPAPRDERTAAARQAEADFYPVLLLFGEAPGGARGDGEAQAALAAALPALRALGRLLGHLEAAAASLLGQLGALCCAQTRKATILQGAPCAPRSSQTSAGAARARCASRRACSYERRHGAARQTAWLHQGPDDPALANSNFTLAAGAHAGAAFRALAEALGVLARMEALAGHNRHLHAAFAALRRRTPPRLANSPTRTGRGVRVTRPDDIAAVADARLGEGRMQHLLCWSAHASKPF